MRKRYIWHRERVQCQRVFAEKDELGEVTGVANASRNPRRAREYGDTVPADQSNFSRAGIMSFAMVELLLHAIGQMNSVAFREDLGNKTFRRKLKHIVITCPTAMVQSEQVALRSAVLDAIESLKVRYPSKAWSEGLEVVPNPMEHHRQLQDAGWRHATIALEFR